MRTRVAGVRRWLAPARPEQPALIIDPQRRRALIFEIVLVLAVTLGLSGVRGLLALLDALLAPGPLAHHSVAINAPVRKAELLDLAYQLTGVIQLLAWGALGCYLLWRGGIPPRDLGLDRRPTGRDTGLGVGLAAVIGIPGMAWYLLALAAGLNLTVLPSTLAEVWWRVPVLVASAVANALVEELLVVGYLITRLRQLGSDEGTSALASAVLRGSYHLYQGFGGFVGNVVMGLVFGRFWQRTNRLYPLIIAHALIDIIAFTAYPLLF